MIRLFYLFVLLFTHQALLCQESKQVIYGNQSYSININEAFGGGEFHTVSIAANQDMFELIRTMVKE